MTGARPLSFGIKTLPQAITYDELLHIWQQADAIPEIDHAWLWDHMMPMRGDGSLPIFEGWTMLTALAARTERLQLGLLVTSNRIRPPAVLAKIAATVDAISHGRLVLGIGVGGTHQPGENPAVREFAAYGLTLVPPAEGIGRLDEACTILRRMWTEELFDHDGKYYQLNNVRCKPKPEQPGGPKILIGGWGEKSLLPLIARQGDLWTIPGPPFFSLDDIARKSDLIDQHCTAIGRDPHEIDRSVQINARYDDPEGLRKDVLDLISVGINHIVIGLPMPFPDNPSQWVADQVVKPVRDQLSVG
jgi:alkanesulfonate monooxygenase SsuD/methylene tetrahydromethanopterin reductase-like flavin-dependent oxidoreductase (luciferase family)